MVHRHCEERAPPCKAQIESGSYVTMSRKKVVKNLEDLDELTQFLLEKVREMIYSYKMNDFLRAALMGGEEDTKGNCWHGSYEHMLQLSLCLV